MPRSTPVTERRASAARNWGLYVLLWFPAFVLGAVTISLRPGTPLGSAVSGSLVTVGVAAGLGVAVWWLTGMVPWPEQHRARFVVLHAGGAFLYAALYAGLQFLALATRVGISHARVYMPPDTLGWMAISGLYLYCMVAGVAYTVRTRRRLREEQLNAAHAEALAAWAQVEALRARLQPHFLFNAIHSLSALAREDPAAVEVALERLGDLLRYALDQGDREMVSLEAEWEFTRNYLELERIRFGERLKVVSDLSADALRCRVPSLVLQPVVENAVRHGLSGRARGGTVEVRARCVNGTLELRVRDDGVGADAAAADGATGFGVRTLRQRLAALYDGRATLAIETAPGTGFTVDVSLPAEREEG